MKIIALRKSTTLALLFVIFTTQCFVSTDVVYGDTLVTNENVVSVEPETHIPPEVISDPVEVIDEDFNTPLDEVAQNDSASEDAMLHSNTQESTSSVIEIEAVETASSNNSGYLEDRSDDRSQGTTSTSTMPEMSATTSAAEETMHETVATTSSSTNSESRLSNTSSEIHDDSPTTTLSEEQTVNAIETVGASLSSSTENAPSLETVTITTGDSIGLANVLNVVNTSVVNSNGSIVFSNILEDQMGPIDFRENSTSTSGCILSACGHVDGISLHLSNDAYVQNAILVDASSGNSYIETDLATRAFIETGNSFAGLNLMNIVNTTVVNSNYLLVTLNAFRNILGDIIFPNWSYAPYDLSPTPSLDTTYIINTGNVENNISTDAHAGTNVLTGTNGTIHTGNAEAATNIFNMMNTSLIGGDSISILLNIRGAWIGDIFGLPAGMDVTRGLGGQYYITRTPPGGQLHASSILSATNTAIIQNDVSINARTGNNEIQGSETALITTGDAFTGANIVNIANTTIVGRNWTLAVLNIFGDFNGNIAFGRPDLWVGEQIAVPSDLENGKELVYTFTLMNNGDAEATRVTLIDTYDPTYLEIVESSAAFTTMGRHVSWEIPSLSPGESTEVSYRARVKNTSPGTSITNTVTVTSRETDNNIIDNTDTGTVQLHTVSTHSRGNRHTQNDRHISTIEKKDAQSAIKISVVRNTSSTTVSNTDRNVIQEVVIQNVGTTTIKGLIFHDILSDFAEQVIQDEIWDIGNLLPHEEVTLRYNISFEADAHSGLYTFSSVVELPDFTDVVFHSNGIVMLLPPMLNVLTSASSYAPISQKTIDPEVSVPMGLFVPIIAHAEESDQSAMLIRAGHTTISSLYVYILLMMVLISMGIYIHRRNL